jgi:GNAT superfamily N-acetyltransferase
LVELRTIERLAGARFREVGLDSVAEDEPMSVGALAEYASSGRAWVAVDEADRPVGYILVDVVDGLSHIEQLTVRPDWQRRGVGMSLIWAAAAAADRAGLPHSLTLTTFDGVPWNRPLFERLGFRVLAEGDIGEDLGRVRLAEAARGLDPATRVAMRLDYEVSG